MNENPLVTVLQLSYNNEAFIEEAFNSVLAQTYRPIQIIVSDDCSQDESWAIIQEKVKHYSGPHKIILNRNDKNLGLGNNVNRAMEIAEGEWIVEFDGDDISYPDRVEEVVKMWRESGEKIKVVCGESLMIDETGKQSHPLPKLKPMAVDKVLHPGRGQWVHGGSLAWHRSLFDIFGSLKEGVVAQDKAIGFRSLLLGQQIGYIEKPTIQYRVHSSNLTNDRTTKERLVDKVAMLEGFVQDFGKARKRGYLDETQDLDIIQKRLVDASFDFSLRYKVLFSGLLKSFYILLTSGNKVSFVYRKNLLKKRLFGKGTN